MLVRPDQRRAHFPEHLVGDVAAFDTQDRDRTAQRLRVIGIRREARIFAPVFIAYRHAQIAPGQRRQRPRQRRQEVALAGDRLRPCHRRHVIAGGLRRRSVTEQIERCAGLRNRAVILRRVGRRRGIVGIGIERRADDIAIGIGAHVQRAAQVRFDQAGDQRRAARPAVIGRGIPGPFVAQRLEVAGEAADEAVHVLLQPRHAGDEVRIRPAQIEDVVVARRQAVRQQVLDDDRLGLWVQEGVAHLHDVVAVDVERARCRLAEEGGVIDRLAGEVGRVAARIPGLTIGLHRVGQLVIEQRRRVEAIVVDAQVGDVRHVERIAAEERRRIGRHLPGVERHQRAVGREAQQVAVGVCDAARLPQRTAIEEIGIAARLTQEGAHVLHEHLLIRRIRQRLCRIARIERRDEARLLGDHAALAAKQAVVVVIFRIDGDVAATTREVLADERTDALVAQVTALADPGLPVEVDALVIVLQDDVDRAGDRVRAIDGGAADRHGVDALDQFGRDRIQVDLPAAARRRKDGRGIGTDEAPAVDQRQRALRAQAVQVDEALADAEPVALVAQRRAVRHRKTRQLIDRIGDIGIAAIVEQLRIDDVGRLGIVDRGAPNARSGDDDVVAFRARGRRRRRRLRRRGGGGIGGLG